VRDLRLSQTGDALLRAFSKLRASTLLGGMTYRDVNEAMVAVPRASFTEPLIAVLAAKIVRPPDREDRAGIDAYRDQLFWQTTAAQVLGELRAERAIAPLMDVMLDPDKADIHATAVLALVKLGKRAVPRVTPLLAEDRSRAMAAIVLGTIGRSEAEAAMIAAAATASDVDRAIIARELTKLPATPASKVAFKAAFEKTPLALTVPPGLNGLTMLAEAAGQFYDPALVDWLIDRAAKARGQREDVAALRATIAVMIIKLARPDQLAKAKTAAGRWGTQLERDLHQKASDLVQRCAKTASCYVGEMANPANQRQERQFVAIKAAYMAAIFGDAKTRAEILAKLDAFENAAVRFVAAQAIDHLSPRGSREAAAQIRAVIERNAASGSADLRLSDAPLRQVMYRLDTRAE
jgi:hypothetical protein